MEKIKIWDKSASGKQLQLCAKWLEDGNIGVIPTDSCYAIVGDALNVKSVERICKLKGINTEKTNLSIICADLSMAAEYCKMNNDAFRLMKQNVPGAFTFLLPSVSTLPKAFKGRKTVGIRIPDYPFDRVLAETLQHPLITTSIALEDPDYIINPELLAEQYEKKVDFFVDGGDGTDQLTTIVDCTSNPPEIIREGLGIL